MKKEARSPEVQIVSVKRAQGAKQKSMTVGFAAKKKQQQVQELVGDASKGTIFCNQVGLPISTTEASFQNLQARANRVK